MQAILPRLRVLKAIRINAKHSGPGATVKTEWRRKARKLCAETARGLRVVVRFPDKKLEAYRLLSASCNAGYRSLGHRGS